MYFLNPAPWACSNSPFRWWAQNGITLGRPGWAFSLAETTGHLGFRFLPNGFPPPALSKPHLPRSPLFSWGSPRGGPWFPKHPLPAFEEGTFGGQLNPPCPNRGKSTPETTHRTSPPPSSPFPAIPPVLGGAFPEHAPCPLDAPLNPHTNQKDHHPFFFSLPQLGQFSILTAPLTFFFVSLVSFTSVLALTFYLFCFCFLVSRRRLMAPKSGIFNRFPGPPPQRFSLCSSLKKNPSPQPGVFFVWKPASFPALNLGAACSPPPQIPVPPTRKKTTIP